MQQLVGRLTALDPGASEALKVIAYFDTLIDGHATAEMIVRGAATFSGSPAGFASAGTVTRVNADGVREQPTEVGPVKWPAHDVPGGGIAWIERNGDARVNDAIVLERLAIAVGIMLERSIPHTALRRAIETVLDPAESVDARRMAGQRLGLQPTALFRVIATPASIPARTGDHQTIITTSFGAVRAIVRRAGAETTEIRAGIGDPVTPDGLYHSFRSALVALRLTTDRVPVQRSDDLGVVVTLAAVADEWTEQPADVAAISRVIEQNARTLVLLDAVIGADSLRSAANDLGLHHSTVQARVAEVSAALGFDFRTPIGRTRLSLALNMYRLATTRF